MSSDSDIWTRAKATDDLQAGMADVPGFLKLSGLLKRLCGINLPESSKNLTLMAGRMRKIRERFGGLSYREIYDRIEAGDDQLKQAFINAMTTNTTQFFREPGHFETLGKLIPQIMAEKRKKGINEFRMWCGASSTGQEPYCLLMTALEALGELTTGFKFLATDIDGNVLRTARSGTYDASVAREIPPQLVSKYFLSSTVEGERVLTVRSQYRSMITFALLNLVETPYPFQHKFDVIFLRNVMIYFDKDTIQKVVDGMYEALAPGGYLFLGHSEAMSGVHRGLQRIGPSVYRKTPASLIQGIRKSA